jgi:hypothetical protein
MNLDMSRTVQLVALLLIAVASVSALGAHFLPLQSQPLERPAGCHEHGSKVPAQIPSSSQCCLIGHNTAVSQTTDSPEPISNHVQHEKVVEVLAMPLVSGSETLFLSYGDPPGLTALRI